ncbi:MAG: SCP2 sterol-binding domain-containing protein [Sandaracinaceae bacterium]|nr:SCP2 sterol-binding domain-containing protein [Sandaracinaceae bacterium]
MGIRFPSAEWTAAFKDAINANEQYAKHGAGWTHGKVAYVVEPRPELGIEGDTAMVLDLHEGHCRGAVLTSAEAAEEAEFVIFAEYERWREVLSGEVDPTKAMMQNKLKLRQGHLPTIVKFVLASKELVRAACTIDTDYPG